MTAKKSTADNSEFDIVKDRAVHDGAPGSDLPPPLSLRTVFINLGIAAVLLLVGLVYAFFYQQYQLRESAQLAAFNDIKKKCDKDPAVVVESHSITGKTTYTLYTSVNEEYDAHKAAVAKPFTLAPEFVDEYYCTPAEAHARHADISDSIENYDRPSDIDAMEVDMALLEGYKFYGPGAVPEGFKIKIRYLNSITTPTVILVRADDPDAPTEAEKNGQRRDQKTYVRLECKGRLVEQSFQTDEDLSSRPDEFSQIGQLEAGNPVFRTLPGKKDNAETYGQFLRVNLPAAGCELSDAGRLLSDEAGLALMTGLRELSRDEAVEWAGK